MEEATDELDELDAQWAKEDLEIREQMNMDLARSIQRPLGVCRTLIAQAAEFLLKAKIAEISPFILIRNNHAKWPGKDQSFSEFQTIDAGDLVRVCNSVRQQQLAATFVTIFETLRRERNVHVHGVSPPTSVPLSEVSADPLRLILDVAHHLADESWRDIRAWFVTNYDPATILTHGEQLADHLAHEMAWLIERLKPAESRKYLNFDRNGGGRNYLCPFCYHGKYDYIPEAKFAKVVNDEVFCFVCNAEYPIARRPCPVSGCKGDVFSADDSECLTCGEWSRSTA